MVMWFALLIQLSNSCSLTCNTTMIKDGNCDIECMTAACNFDGGDCKSNCTSKSCTRTTSNNVCNQNCNHDVCGFDFGDCLECSPGCNKTMQTNSKCDLLCDFESCNYDNTKCYCSPACPTNLLLNNQCDLSCNISACSYDNGDCLCSMKMPENCSATLLLNKQCDEVCNVSECFYDYESCFCAPGCHPSMINNSVCNKICNNKNCSWDGGDCDCSEGCNDGMLRDNKCDEACNNSYCKYDDGDCDCAQGCSPAWINNSICNKVCNVSECFYDWSDCNCNLNCHQSMINDSICDPDCNVSKCNYDGEDCECAEGCNPGMIGDGKCDESCNNTFCLFDIEDCYCNEGCNLTLLTNDICDPECDVKKCYFDWGKCGSCASGCFEDMIFNNICDEKCRVEDCEYDYRGCFNTFFYWANDGKYAVDDENLIFNTSMTEYFEFTDNDKALNAKIFMLGGDFWFFNQSNVFNRLKSIIVSIEPWYCKERFIQGCYEEGIRPVFHVLNGFNFRVNMKLTLKNIDFTVFHNLSCYESSEGCEYYYDSSQYCQYIRRVGYQVWDDRYTRIDGIFDDFLNESICNTSIFIDFFEIDDGGILNMSNVAFRDIRYLYNSIITIHNGSVILQNVNFFNIVANYGSAVIQTFFNNCLSEGSQNIFKYDTGNVSFINNGYEIIPENLLASFLSLCSINETVIKNIYFSMNLFSGPDSRLLDISKFFRLELKNLTISYHMSSADLIKIDQLNISEMVSQSPRYLNVKHILIQDLNITNSLASDFFTILYDSDCQNLEISRNSFENNEVINSLIEYSINFNHPLCINGRNSSAVNPTIEKRSFEIYDSVFKRNLGKFLIKSKKAVNFNVKNLTFIENFGVFGNISEIIMEEIKRHSGYARNSSVKGRKSEECLLSCEESVNFLMDQLNFRKNSYCLAQVLENYRNFEFRDSEIVENDSLNMDYLFFVERGISRVNTVDYAFNNLIFEGNKIGNTSKAIIMIPQFSDKSLNFIKISFIKSDQAFYINDARYVYFHSLLILDSISKSNSFLFYMPAADSELQILSSTFTNSSCQLISINASSLTKVNLSVKDSQFLKNSGKSLIVIDNRIELKPSSLLTSSLIQENSALFMYLLSAGNLSINSNQFIRNSCKDFVALVSEGEGSLLFAYNKFQENKGKYLIFVSSETNSSVLEIFNSSFIANRAGAVKISNILYKDSYSYYANNSYSTGTILYSTTSSVAIIKNSFFFKNQANSGGNIENIMNSEMFLFYLTVENNLSFQKGGFLLNDQNSTFSISSSKFSNNKAYQGSSVYSHNSKNLNHIKNSSFISNSALSSGCISLLMSSLFLESSSFKNNEGSSYSIIDLSFQSTITIKNSSFNNEKGSGGLFLIGSQSFAFLISCNFSNSFTENISSFFYIFLSHFECQDCRIFSGKSKEAGSIFCDNSNCSFVDSYFEEFDNGKSGATVVAEGSFLNLTRVKIGKSVGSALLLRSKSQLFLKESKVYDTVALYGSGIRCLDCKDVFLWDSRLENCSSEFYGGGIFASASSEGHSMFFEGAEIFNCSAQSGGGLFLSNLELSIKSTSFINNSAHPGDKSNSGEGGAIFIDTSDFPTTSQITSSNFHQNSATKSGGGIQWYSSKPILSQTTFSNNTSFYGKDLSSFCYQLESRTSKKLILTPGFTLPEAIILSVTDHYNQTVLTDQETSVLVTIRSTKNVSLLGTTKQRSLFGTFSFSDLALKGKPDETTVFEFFAQISRKTDGNLAVRVPVLLRNCTIGESFEAESCIRCEKGFYNLKADESCKKCPLGAICYGGAEIVADKGFWRTDNMSDVFYECFYQPACLKERIENGVEKCLKGYTGVMCQACLFGYSRSGDNKCVKCIDRGKNIGYLIGIGLVGLVVIVGLSVSNIKGAYRDQSVTSVYFKILTNYIQIVAITISFDLNWPSFVSKMLKYEYQASGATSQIYSIDCFLPPNFTAYYAKLLILNLIPLFTGFLTIIFFLLINLCFKTSDLPSKMIGSIIVQIFFFQPSIIQANFSMFNCLKLSNGKFYMTKETSIECWSRQHLFYTLALSVPGIGLWCILVPVVLLVSLRRARLNLDKIWERLKYGFLYKGYKDGFFYWEFLIFFRKLGIISCAVFLSNYSVYVQALCTFIFVGFGFLLQLRWQPFKLQQLNKMEIRSIVVSAVTLYAGLFFMTDELNEFWKIVLFVFMILANFAFLYYWAFFTFGYYFAALCEKFKCFKKGWAWVQKVMPEATEEGDVNNSPGNKGANDPPLTSPTVDPVEGDFKGRGIGNSVNVTRQKRLKLKWVRIFK